MKIVHINTFPNKSTGSIMMNLHKKLLENGDESYVVWGRGRKSNNKYEIYMNDKIGVYFHALYTRLTDKTGFASTRSTKKLLKKLDEIKPDIVHLHNIHGYYINIELLFNYLKKNRIRVIWTLHDCWSFTGHCPHFELIDCNKWKDKCFNCPLISKYPKSTIDNSEWNYLKKKSLFTGLNMTIVTPSKWLANLVKQSFLKDYNVKVINNGVDTNIFKSTESDFREKYNLKDKKIILGVASEWTKEKGLYDFFELSKILDDSYKIVLVGLNERQLKQIPNNIIGIKRTDNPKELAEIYTAADIYFNSTYADNFPTTNIEALACGTPVATYNTGGSPECINENNGIIIAIGDYQNLLKFLTNLNRIKRTYNVDNFTKEQMESQYINIYKGGDKL